MARTRKVSGDAAASTGGFTPYPVGEYIGQIIDVKQDKIKNGPNKGKVVLNVQFKFTEAGPGEGYVGKKFTAFRVPDFPEWESGSAAFQHFQFYKALGVVFPPKGEEGEVEYPDFEDMLGEEVGLQIGLEDSNKPDPDNEGEFIKRNNVVRFYPAADGVKDTSAEGGEEDEFTL